MRVALRHKQDHIVVDVTPQDDHYRVGIDGREHVVEARYLDDGSVMLSLDDRVYRIDLARTGRDRLVAVAGEVYAFVAERGASSAHDVATVAAPEITAPMPGKVLQVLAHPGDHVEPGDALLILEAMKMETRLVAEAAGTVSAIRVTAGDLVDGGQVLAVLVYDE